MLTCVASLFHSGGSVQVRNVSGLRVEFRDPALIHRGKPDCPRRSNCNPRLPVGKPGFNVGTGYSVTLAVFGSSLPMLSFAEIRVPRDPLRIHDDVVRLDDGAGQVVLRDDDLRVLALGTRECLQRIRPRRAAAQVDRAEILGDPLPATAGAPRRAAASSHRAGRFCMCSGKLEFVYVAIRSSTVTHLSRVVLGLDDAFERVADGASEQRGLLIVGARHARQPLRIRELGREIFRGVQGEIGGDSLARRTSTPRDPPSRIPQRGC